MSPAAEPDPPTFAARWRAAVRSGGDRTFLRYEAADGTVTSFTYAAWDHIVAEVAGGLGARGVGPGDRVHVALGNSPAFVAAWLACVRLGAVLSPSDPRATPRELDVHRTMVRPALTVTGSDGDGDVRLDDADVELGALRARPVPEAPVGPLDPAAVLFTSGTTSAPKGVVVTQANYAWAGDVMSAAAGVGADDRLLVALPLFHANAQYYSFAAAISAGASVALMSGFSASRFFGQAAAHEATHASLFAAPVRMILDRGGAPRGDLRLRHVWYAQNLTHEHLEAFAGLAGCRPRQLYGMTETIAAVLSQRPTETPAGSLGEPTLGCAVAVAEDGELLVGGRRGRELFLEYLDDPQTTASGFRDGWFATGDLVAREGAGLRFAGRRGDVLKVAGENVSTLEVEEVLAAHPGVHEVAVVGEPDPVRDEVPVAYVVAVEGAGLDVESLQAHAARSLARAKRPREVHLVDALPHTSVGKIRKFLLQDPAG